MPRRIPNEDCKVWERVFTHKSSNYGKVWTKYATKTITCDGRSIIREELTTWMSTDTLSFTVGSWATKNFCRWNSRWVAFRKDWPSNRFLICRSTPITAQMAIHKCNSWVMQLLYMFRRDERRVGNLFDQMPSLAASWVSAGLAAEATCVPHLQARGDSLMIILSLYPLSIIIVLNLSINQLNFKWTIARTTITVSTRTLGWARAASPRATAIPTEVTVAQLRRSCQRRPQHRRNLVHARKRTQEV